MKRKARSGKLQTVNRDDSHTQSEPPKRTPPSGLTDEAPEAVASHEVDVSPRLKTVQAAISILSLSLGLPAAVAGVWHIMRPLPPSTKEALKTEKLQIDIRTHEPTFKVTYVTFKSDTFPEWERGETSSLGSLITGRTLHNDVFDRITNFSGRPALQDSATPSDGRNPSLDSNYKGPTRNSHSEDWTADSIDWTSGIDSPEKLRAGLSAGTTQGETFVCLQLTQEGARHAENLRITFRRFSLPKGIALPEIGLLANDDWMKQRGLSRWATEEKVDVNTLEVHESLIVPLCIVEKVYPSAENEELNSWKLVRKSIYLPICIEYYDRATDKQNKIPIRRMYKVPEVIASGVETRG
jgi:hypothetical protein